MRRALLAAWIVSGAGWLVLAAPAQAACHAFAVGASPVDPVEGGTVEVTVTRDAAVNPSSVRVRTADQTATGGRDYEAVDRRIEFTAGTEQTFTIRILQDQDDEPAESFRITLSEGSGCQVNPSFTYGDPATVSIQDDDAPTATTGGTAAPTTRAPATTRPAATTTAAAPTTAVTTTTTGPATTVPSPTTDAVDTTEPATTTTAPEGDEVAGGAGEGDGDGDGAAGWLIAAAALVAAAVAGVAYRLYRTRATGG